MITRLLVTLLLVLALFGMYSFQVIAQADECPEELVCIEWQENLIQIDPECGPVQAFVVSETLTQVTNLEGVDSNYALEGIVVVKSGDTYEVVSYFSEEAEGPLEGVRFGDNGCLVWGQDSE